MSEELGSLLVRIEANAGNFYKVVDGVGDKLQSVSKKMSDVGKNLSLKVTGPILAVGGGLLALAKKTANTGDAFQKMALRTGISVETLSELKHAAELSGTSLETVEGAVKRMQKGLLNAEQGMSSSVESLGALNLTIQDLQNLSPEQQFDKLSAAIAEIENPSRRAALAQEIFGRAGTELLPMLSEGADGIAKMRQEARDLGIVFDQDAADAAAKFNDDLDRLKKGFGGVFQELGMKLIPIFTNDLIPAIREHIIPLAQRFAEKLLQLIDWFKNLSPETQKFVGIAAALAVALGPVLMIAGALIGAIAAIVSPVGLVVLAIVALIAIGVLLYKNWDKIKEKAIEIWTSVKEGFVAIWDGIKEIFFAAMEWVKQLFLDYHPIGLVIKHWETIKGFFAGLWDSIKDKAKTGWGAIASVIKGVINNIIGFFNRIPAGFENIINGLGRVINSIPSFSIPDWVPGIGGKSFGLPNIPSISLPRIPQLAKGTNFVPYDTLAFLHKGEAVVPAKNNPSEIDYTKLARAFVEAMSGSDRPVYITMDGKTVAKGLWPNLVGEKQRLGVATL